MLSFTRFPWHIGPCSCQNSPAFPLHGIWWTCVKVFYEETGKNIPSSSVKSTHQMHSCQLSSSDFKRKNQRNFVKNMTIISVVYRISHAYYWRNSRDYSMHSVWKFAKNILSRIFIPKMTFCSACFVNTSSIDFDRFTKLFSETFWVFFKQCVAKRKWILTMQQQ